MASPFNRYNLGLFDSGTYIPTIVDVEDVSQSNPALVTTTIDHYFVIGQQVQFFIPTQWGMRQLNTLKGYISAIPNPDQFVVNIDTTFFDPFTTPSPPQYIVIDPAQVAGIGDQNTGTLSPGGIPVNPNTIPGAFQNIPPN